MKPTIITKLIIYLLLSVGLIYIGINEIKELNSPNIYSIEYGTTEDLAEKRGVIAANQSLAVIFWLVSTLIIIGILLYIKVKSSRVSKLDKIWRAIKGFSLTELIPIGLLISTIFSYLYLINLSTALPEKPSFPMSRPPYAELYVDTPSIVKANEPFPLIVNLELRGDFGKQAKYEGTVRIQSGFTIPDNMQDWQPKKQIEFFKKIEWRWILTPALDRYGNQPVLVEGAIYSNNKLIAEAKPIKVTVEVRTPLGMSASTAYWITFLGLIFALPFFAIIGFLIKYKWFTKES